MTAVGTPNPVIDDETFVISLYRALLDRNPDSDGLKAHLDALRAGLARDELRDSFLDSNEYAERKRALTGIPPRTLHALSLYPIWWLDDIANEPEDAVTVRGWALGHRDYVQLGELTLNGKRALTFERNRAPDIVARMPWFRGSAQRFTAKFGGMRSESSKTLRLSFVRGELLEPFNRWQDIYFPLDVWQQGSYVAPDAARLIRMENSHSVFHYVMRGNTLGQMLAEVVQTYFGREISQYKDICDWGCGYGQVAQAVHRLAPDSKITGIDTDADSILWSRENLKYARFRVLPLVPPTSLAAEQFDLLYGISVFTHLKSDAFEAWRNEIHRIVRPGAIVLVTLHGAGSLAMNGSLSLISQTLATGFGDTCSNEELTDSGSHGPYDSSTYVTQRRAAEVLGESFRIRDIVPLANFHQNLAVCERV